MHNARRLRSAVTKVIRILSKSTRMKDLEALREEGFPTVFVNASKILINEGMIDDSDKMVAARVERIRSELAATDGGARVFYSPKPGSSDNIKSTGARPSIGEEQSFDYSRLAHSTSVAPSWGQAIYTLGKDSNATTAVELGSCAGISGAYLASIPTLTRFETIEGSEVLAAIATQSIGQISDMPTVNHGLFDNVLDTLIPTLGSVDLVWIDGHHESVATIHYFERLIPTLTEGALVLFDDIYWSQDMLDGWKKLASYKGFSHTVDMGKLGAGIWVGGDATPKRWDIRELIGTKGTVGNPLGWTDNK